MGAVQKHDRIAKLTEQLEAAQARSKELNAELNKLQRKVDASEERERSLREQIALCQIEGWGHNPDWRAMLKGDTMAMYHALEACLDKISLRMAGYRWSDVKERIITVAIDSGEIGAVARKAAAIALVLPHMRAHEDGAVWFNIGHSEAEHSAWTLRITKKKKVELVQEVHGIVQKRLPFPTLEAALTHVQDKLWSEDILEAQPVALLDTAVILN